MATTLPDTITAMPGMILGTIIALISMIIYLIASAITHMVSPLTPLTQPPESATTISESSAHSATISGSADTRNSEQTRALSKYRYLKPTTKMSFNEFCYPKTFSIQPQQIFAGEYMKPLSPPDDSKRETPKHLLVYHRIGAGKTCLSIQIGLKWISSNTSQSPEKGQQTVLGPPSKGQSRPLYIMPASLIPGFRDELRSQCAGDRYLTSPERSSLRELTPGSPEYKAILSTSDARIDEQFQIYSYNKFLTAQGGPRKDRPRAGIIIIDEVQNINNPVGASYKAILEWITDNPSASVVIMSGTPLFDSPDEIHGLAKLLRISEEVTLANIPKLFAGKVSYFAGAPKFTFPEATIKIKRCVMSAFQTRWYSSEVAAEMKKQKLTLREVSNDFYIKSRQRANVVYPKGLTGQAGLDELTPAIIRGSIETYSVKMSQILKQLNKCKLSFLYSGFTEYGGIKFITKCLDAFGYQNFFKAGPGKKRYAVWSGEQTLAQKGIIKTTFNRADNDSARQLQLVIGSPSIKEGVTLLRVRKVMIDEAYWNHSRLEQIYGRAVRYCSHKTVPIEERKVDIYIYAAVVASARRNETDPSVSIDLHMLAMADKKRSECEKYLLALIDCAVDKFLWQNK